MTTHSQILAEANLRPTITDELTEEKSDFPAPDRTFIINFPGVSLEKLSSTPLRLQAELAAQITERERDVADEVKSNLTLININPLQVRLHIPENWCGEQAQLRLRICVQPDIANSPLKANDEYLFYAISLRSSGNKEPIKGDSSIKLKPPLKWAEIKPENLHV
jgi:hypothetical protein